MGEQGRLGRLVSLAMAEAGRLGYVINAVVKGRNVIKRRRVGRPETGRKAVKVFAWKKYRIPSKRDLIKGGFIYKLEGRRLAGLGNKKKRRGKP